MQSCEFRRRSAAFALCCRTATLPERLMRENGLRTRPRRRGLPKDTGERAAVLDNILDRLIGRGLFAASSEGVPQGCVLSPLLSNIMLHEFDAWLEAKYLNRKARKGRGAWNFGIQQGRPITVRENRQ